MSEPTARQLLDQADRERMIVALYRAAAIVQREALQRAEELEARVTTEDAR